MKIQVEEFGKVTVIKPVGQLVHPDGDAALRESIRTEIDRGRSLFVLDLGQVPFVDSAGMGEMVACLKRAKESGGSLKLADVSQRVSDTLMLLGLTEILDTYETSQEAIATYV